jgi:BirA family biotin operon repressor/biotin-[acetyl-CoA-carboxylase] ligase
VPAVMISRYSFAASLSLVRVLQAELGIDARVKWPNDILIHDKKVCGMLAEMEVESDLVSFLNIGIGLNVNNHPSLKEPNSISLSQLLGQTVSRKLILESFLNRMEIELAQPSLDHIIPQWKQHTITLNRKVQIVTTTETWEGIAVDIDDDGALLLKQADHSIKKVYYGDCFHQI